MKPRIALVCFLAAAVGGAGALASGQESARSLGWNSATYIVPDDGAEPSRDLVANHDGSFEDAFCFQFGGVVPATTYGAMAEGFVAPPGREQFYEIDTIILWVTQDGSFADQTLDLYVWEQGVGSAPGAVLYLSSGRTLTNVPMWPGIGENQLDCGIELPTTDYALGYWADFSASLCGWYLAADRGASAGHPWADVAPGLGYPTGWQDAEVVWQAPIGALGIGASVILNVSGVEEPDPVASPEPSTWGLIKDLYR